MRAWQFDEVRQPLILRDIPEPEPGPGEVAIDVRAAGLCHTDVGILHDPQWTARIGPFPLTLGHELAGTVRSVGDGVEDFAVGDRVGVFPAGRTRPGQGRNGGYSFVCTALTEDLVRIPDAMDFPLAAIGTDAGRAAYRAVVRRGGVHAGQRVGIIGLGGLGQMGARIAVLFGAQVYAAEPRESVWPMARSLGVKGVAADLSVFEDVEFDLIVDFAGFGTTTAGAIEAIGDFGTVVQVGMGRLAAEISTGSLIFKQATLIGSRGGSVDDIADVYALMADGRLVPEFSTIGFADIPDGLDQLHAGRATGRIVAVY